MRKTTLQEAFSEAKFCKKDFYSVDMEEQEHNVLYFNEYQYYIELENGGSPWLESYDIDTQELWLASGEAIKNPNVMTFEVYRIDEEEHCKYVLELEGYTVTKK